LVEQLPHCDLLRLFQLSIRIRSFYLNVDLDPESQTKVWIQRAKPMWIHVDPDHSES
jgi:hypothetical protein